MLVTEPVRSGQRIYAQGTDLIVIATVNPGAEVIADGNIHVYGALRGRAMAGAADDPEARIFAHEFRPRAGRHRRLLRGARGAGRARRSARAVQVRLEGEQMRFEPLG